MNHAEPSMLCQPSPRRPKRRFSALLEDLGVYPENRSPSRPPSKRAHLSRSDHASARISDWLAALPPYRRKTSDPLCRRTSISVPRARSAPATLIMPLKNVAYLPLPSRSSAADNRQSPASSISSFPLTSQASRGSIASSSTSQRFVEVESPEYRWTHLAANSIIMRSPGETLPQTLDPILRQIRSRRDSPQPTLKSFRDDKELYALEDGASGPAVEKYFKKHVFFDREADVRRDDRTKMHKAGVPHTQGSRYRVSQPVPSSLFGYIRNSMGIERWPRLIELDHYMAANSSGLLYPFLALEVKGDAPSSPGSLAVATNQCLGDASTCVSIAESLNQQLREARCPEVHQIDTCAFSIALGPTEARLYISWKAKEFAQYQTQRIENYMLQRPEEIVTFRRHVRNIIDWGGKGRLIQLHTAVHQLLEACQRAASERAKSRPRPDDEQISTNKRVAQGPPKTVSPPEWI